MHPVFARNGSYRSVISRLGGVGALCWEKGGEPGVEREVGVITLEVKITV